VIITNTYEVAGREEHEQKDPAVELSQELGVQPHWYAASWAEAEKLLEEHYTADDILLFMGAGSIDSLARNTLRHA
jgi:UDP-N-acetylmuramate-alanine ligase